ncbi:inter-alpha-trypsin inhibitor heavy chain H4-like isoform X4 [Pararge aegeria]|uniref:inter-alpha-trypsin inhibitor heavy chain H4-like isoform X4 n=1 Tax=Pararge aegeria TaxID=116150 RepID=UPI0019D0A4FF|nr:inter-alpha-trypsin inhibitor heavy chain H4-like isoform X4 [Pararge aegeria]
MKPRWPMIVLCISVLAASTYSYPTKDEYVVFADNNQKSTVPIVDTTERPLAPVKMTDMRVRSEVALRYARTLVVTRVHNPDKRAQEVTYRMLLPETAFISGFTMILSGKSYKAYVKEKEEAKQIYTQAVSQGIGAAHIATKARDSNHFTVSVNVEGNTTAEFEMRYEEFLVRRNGLYNHAINLHPGAFVPKMEVVVHIKESQKITTLRVPELRTGNEVDATEKDPQNKIAAIQRGTNEREATITFTPDIKEQRRLAAIYVDKTKEKSSSEKYIGYSSDEEEDDDDNTVLGQFVVQYDVDRTDNNEILVNDGYFVHLLAPTSLTPLSKYVVFVLDTSGSMMGRKIVQLRNAMEAILSDLKPNDYFSIVEFNSDVKVHELKEADEEPSPTNSHYYSYFESRPSTPVTLVPSSPATAQNIAKAKVIVSRLNASGGTNIFSALDVALNLVQKGAQKKNETEPLPKAAAVAVTSTEATQKKGKELEPIIIFLTDGDPTVGETNTARIITSITEKNSGEKRAALYSLAFGEDADRTFLRKVSLRNEGFMRHIYEAADAALQLHDFYRQVSSPLLSHVQFLYPSKQIKEGSVSKTQFRTINAGSEVAIVGQIADDVTELTPEVSGFCGNDDGVGRKRYQISPKVTVSRNKDESLPLERLWAYLTIKQLLDKRDADDDQSIDENSPEKKALAIALKYEFVTPLTSLVVVKPEQTNAVDVESVDKTSDDSSIAYQPIVGPRPPSAPRPNNAYLTSNFASFASSALLPGGPAPSFAQGGLPLALDAAQFPEALVEDEVDSAFPQRNMRPVAFISSSSSRQQQFDFMDAQRNQNRYSFSGGSGGGGGGGFVGPQRPSYGASMDYGGYSAGFPGLPGPSGYGGYGAGMPGRPAVSSHVGYSSVTDFYISSPRPITAKQPAYATTTAQSSDNIELYEWTESLLNPTNNSLVFNDDGTEVILELSSDVDPPKADGGDGECSNSTSTSSVGANENAGNVCVYLTRCYTARSITADDYQKSYCIVNNNNNRYAGICCARSEVDKNP